MNALIRPTTILTLLLLPAALGPRDALAGPRDGGGKPTQELQQNTPVSTDSGPAPAWYIQRDVPGPDFSGLGNNAEDFTVENHVFVVENTRATLDDTDGPSLNTGGIAVVLHSDGDDQLSLLDLDAYDPNDHILNTINRNDHFMTFFRENAAGVRDIVGRIEGLSFWDMGEVNQQIVDFFAESGHLPWNWLQLNVTFNDPSTWLQWTPPALDVSGVSAPSFNGGSLPYFAYNNLTCEGNANEVCLHMGSINVLGTNYNLGEIDTTFSRGTLPTTNWGSLTQPGLGLQLDPGSISATPPIEFGSPFLQVDGAEVDAFAQDLEDFFGSTAPVAYEMNADPIGFAAKYLFALRGGVTYESGSGDYAEWLERLDPDETLQPGEIVGVHGGKVSKRTAGADQAMVVSYKPVVLGNMPSRERAELYDKIAFMGQTLVKVVGVVQQGDFILPSGLDDGRGIAVRPDSIRPEQLASVVGVAWGHGGRRGQLGLVNVAVGLRPVELTRVIGEQQAALDSAEREISALRAQVTTMQASLDKVEELEAAVASLQAVRLASATR